MVKLFVGGFPLDITELDIVQHLSLYGEIATIKIVRDKKTRKCKGYAFVEVIGISDAEQIIEAVGGTMFRGRELTINIVIEHEPVNVPPFQSKDAGFLTPATVRAKRPRLSKI